MCAWILYFQLLALIVSRCELKCNYNVEGGPICLPLELLYTESGKSLPRTKLIQTVVSFLDIPMRIKLSEHSFILLLQNHNHLAKFTMGPEGKVKEPLGAIAAVAVIYLEGDFPLELVGGKQVAFYETGKNVPQ